MAKCSPWLIRTLDDPNRADSDKLYNNYCAIHDIVYNRQFDLPEVGMLTCVSIN